MAMLATARGAASLVATALLLPTSVWGFWDPAVGCANSPGSCGQATPWTSKEDSLVRWASRPGLCLGQALVRPGATPLLALRPCDASAPEQQLSSPASASPGPLTLGGLCAISSGNRGVIRLGSCVEGAANQTFKLPASGNGRILAAIGEKAGCFSVKESTILSSSPPLGQLLIMLTDCGDGDKEQAFLFPRSDAAQSAFVGVNLGGWLILESWMWPAEMESQGIKDEYSLIAKYGGPGDERAQTFMHSHWDTFVQPEHLDTLKRFGVTHVRIPLGFWLFDSVYHESDGFVSGSEPYLARVVGWLKERGMKAILDLHAMPGGQATDSSFTGHVADVANFFHLASNGERGRQAVQALVDLVLSYEADEQTSGVVVGVELLNEPNNRYMESIQAFYSEMVPVVRKSLPADRFMVLLGFMDSPHSASAQWLAEHIRTDPGNYTGVVYDVHLYHLYGDNQSPWTQDQDYCKTCCRDKHIVGPITSEGIPTIVGEYAIATGFGGWSQEGFAQTNLENYLSLWNTTRSVVGSFTWNFRVLVDPAHPMQYLEWSIVDMIDQGYLDPDFVYTANVSSLCPAVAAAHGGELKCPDYSNRTVYWCTTCQFTNSSGRRLSSGRAPFLSKPRVSSGAAVAETAVASVDTVAAEGPSKARLLV